MLKSNIKVKNESIDVKVKNQFDKLKISHKQSLEGKV